MNSAVACAACGRVGAIGGTRAALCIECTRALAALLSDASVPELARIWAVTADAASLDAAIAASNRELVGHARSSIGPGDAAAAFAELGLAAEALVLAEAALANWTVPLAGATASGRRIADEQAAVAVEAIVAGLGPNGGELAKQLHVLKTKTRRS